MVDDGTFVFQDNNSYYKATIIKYCRTGTTRDRLIENNRNPRNKFKYL